MIYFPHDRYHHKGTPKLEYGPDSFERYETGTDCTFNVARNGLSIPTKWADFEENLGQRNPSG